MKSFISEDDIEQAICEHLSQPEFGWKRIACDPSVAAGLDIPQSFLYRHFEPTGGAFSDKVRRSFLNPFFHHFFVIFGVFCSIFALSGVRKRAL